MIEQPKPEELNQIAPQFKRHESVENYDGVKPSRLTYIRPLEPRLVKKSLNTGQRIADNVTVHWDDPTTKVLLNVEKGDWIFTASRAIKGYFSLSVGLASDEIEMLNPNTMIAFGCKQLTKTSKKPITSTIYGKMTFARGNTNSNSYEMVGEDHLERKLVSFSLHDSTIAFHEMFQIWLDFIVAEPNSKMISFRDPVLFFQERILI